jgi:TolB-like protein/DNA-binding winged helix-turn-helix (wHTH) protein
MERQSTTMLRIGAWCVNPASAQISRDGETARVEVRTMRLLLCLAEHAGEVVSIEDLLNQVWSGVFVNPDSVYQAVASLRRLLGDDPKQPTYIETVPRLGYRMVATVRPWSDPPVTQTNAEALDVSKKSGPRFKTVTPWTAGAAVCLALVLAVLFYGRIANRHHTALPAVAPQPQKSIAVLPFLDLTDDMNQEPFADGMTEELIDKLSKIPGLQVTPPTSSFYFKGKLWPGSHGTPQLTVADIAKSLGVAYVLDGSVRKSGARVRIAARLIRADNGFVIWSETYDRPFNDVLMVQDDIAGEVAKALRASIEAGADKKGQPPQ